MIQRLRRRHRMMIAVLAVALAALFIAGLSARPMPPAPNALRLNSAGGAR